MLKIGYLYTTEKASMPSVKIKSETLLLNGPVLEVEIHRNEAAFLGVKNNKDKGSFIKVRLLIDTGANISGLDTAIIRQLALTRYETFDMVDGISGLQSTNRYHCILYLDIFNKKALPIDVLEGDFRYAPYNGVIGRDVLQHCSFHYNGKNNSFQLVVTDF
jgi:predicted aspartyl protease